VFVSCGKSGHFAHRYQLKSEIEKGKHKITQIRSVKQMLHDSPIMINIHLKFQLIWN